MNRRIYRQVLDCGDGVREVTALAVAALKIPKRSADKATLTESGDSEESVAAVQDARAPTRAALGSWSQCAILKSWRLPHAANRHRVLPLVEKIPAPLIVSIAKSRIYQRRVAGRFRTERNSA